MLTGGAMCPGRGCITWVWRADGGGCGRGEKTGTDVLIVTGGAIPW